MNKITPRKMGEKNENKEVEDKCDALTTKPQ
jgi:hypothetical protein